MLVKKEQIIEKLKEYVDSIEVNYYNYDIAMHSRIERSTVHKIINLIKEMEV